MLFRVPQAPTPLRPAGETGDFLLRLWVKEAPI